MKILMIDVGGTNVKLMVSGHDEVRRVPSGKKLTAAKMAKEVLAAAEDWEYEAVTIGFPGLVADGQPVREPLNVGGGWLRYDFKKAFKVPVKFINDAAMQALANYREGRMLFLGLGTSTGCAMVVDHVVIPLEIGSLCLPDGHPFSERLTDKAHEEDAGKWLQAVYPAIEMLREVFTPDDIVIGGGNASEVDPLPPGCRVRGNEEAFLGAARLWPGADMLAEAYGSSWRITQKRKAKKKH